MKNPNGYGSVFKLSGNRRKPYVAKQSATYDDEGRPIQKVIGYYATRKEAMQALALFNANPYDIDSSKTTVAELFEIFKKRRYDKISQSGISVYNAAYKHLSPIHNKSIGALKTYELQSLLDSINRGNQTKSHVQTLLNQMFNIAIELDIVQKNYAKFLKLEPKTKSDIHSPFTNEEIERLWCNIDKPWVDTVLIMIYTGMRPSEMLTLKKEDINLKDRFMTGGLKTKAGKNRQIPICKKILSLIKTRYNDSETYLVEFGGKKLSYSKYMEVFRKCLYECGMHHLPHDGRHTFITLMDNLNVNSNVIKKIVGHSSQDITSAVYTHKSLDVLLEAVDLL